MEIIIRGEPNEIAVLLQRLNWQRMDIPPTFDHDKWFKDFTITCSPTCISQDGELSELTHKRKEETP